MSRDTPNALYVLPYHDGAPPAYTGLAMSHVEAARYAPGEVYVVFVHHRRFCGLARRRGDCTCTPEISSAPATAVRTDRLTDADCFEAARRLAVERNIVGTYVEHVVPKPRRRRRR
ncbi:MAG: hypothetical protein ACREM1_02845 [Longimicrobiales bacterium]